MRKVQVLIFSIFLLTIPLTLPLNIIKAQQTGLELTVIPGESIQRAINEAAPGSTIFIESGVYYEETYPIIVNKTVTLIGRSADATIIDGRFTTTQIVLVKSSGVRILNLTVQNTAEELAGAAGIDLSDVQNVELSRCKIMNCSLGIHLKNSSQCRIIRNELNNNHISGIYLRQNSSRNLIIENTISDNANGIWVADTTCIGNRIYHNNFLGKQTHKGGVGVGGVWHNDYPSGGNYWSDHIRVDYYRGSNQDEPGSDGICDEPYLNLDKYPFIAPLNFFVVGKWGNIEYYIYIISNYTVSELYFNPDNASISYNMRGSVGRSFCRVTIPKQILWVDNGHQWIVLVNNVLVTPFVLDQNNGYTYLYFTYNHDTETIPIEIKGTNAIPEFREGIILVLLTLLLSATAITKNRKVKVELSENILKSKLGFLNGFRKRKF